MDIAAHLRALDECRALAPSLSTDDLVNRLTQVVGAVAQPIADGAAADHYRLSIALQTCIEQLISERAERSAYLTTSVGVGVVAFLGATIGRGVIATHSVIESGAQIGDGVRLGPFSLIGAGTVIGKRSSIASGVVLGSREDADPTSNVPVQVGPDCHLHDGVVLGVGVSIGARATVGHGVHLTPSSRLLDVTAVRERMQSPSVVPPGSILRKASVPRLHLAGNYPVDCAVIVGYRDQEASTIQAIEETI